MTTSTLHRVCTFSLLLLLAGCASEPVIRPSKPQPADTGRLPTYVEPRPLVGIYANQAGVREFIQHMVHDYGFSEDYLNGLFSQANKLDSVLHLEVDPFVPPKPKYTGPVSPQPVLPPKPKPTLGWSSYRKQFLDDAHINNGVIFWRQNAEALQRAAQTYHVDPEYIVGIIGVETYFGRNVGKTNTFDALSTLSFFTIRRAEYFTKELENFLLMTKEENLNPRSVIGSWAGALGLGQFMPKSFRKLAVDFNGDGKRDLWNSEDAIGSVAHYFSNSGWKFNQLVTTPINGDIDDEYIILGTDSGNQFWAIGSNFNCIKKYNSSNKYAMAVHQLGQSIKQRYLMMK
ncbi:MAG: lytic murein transglycosylase [Methylococcales bacterium]|nr:lytic murein transglycosylase [Methylococcales bacterium]